ncbi:hypothetical protein BKA70DRAFT_1299328 [Coprinopsis sp. MPI-PUGE-AT-0042]|nr:hypothetical protein BKA70DRAFT_1299328 [Coprinopsis sp. MPI-PUGE-AT-0042]
MNPPRRRVSYIVPPPTSHVQRLQLPPSGSQRLGAVNPLLIAYPSQGHADVPETPSWARHPRHRLGVAALALDTSTCLAGRSAPEGILYSGGRDGLIISRDLGVSMKRRRVRPDTRPNDRWEMLTGWADDAILEEEDGEDRGTDGDVLGEVTSRKQRSASVSAESAPETHWQTDFLAFKPGVHSEYRQSAQAHSDWINDILLCNHNQTVVSASSDGTIKSWTPHSFVPTDPAIIGTHSDYVRCLALCRERNWIASGSFDRTIKLWDLSRTNQSDPLITLNPADASASKTSVYALAADPFGRTIASGSPERVIRLWDPRTGKKTGKLVGHTDNIRAILLSEDGRYLLTGSADASIKLWSLSGQRCLHTFTHHTESVWSLYSTHPYLETFYSGDRSGLVSRVDVEGRGDLGDGECILLCNESPESGGINRIAVMDDNLLWTATSSSTIKRWNIPNRHSVRDLVSASPTTKRRPLPPIPGTEDYLTRDTYTDDKLNGIPLDSLIKLLSPDDPFTSFTHNRGLRDAEVATLYSAASVMSVPRGVHRSAPSNTTALQSSKTEDTVSPTSIARANYEDRELASDAIPYCNHPDDIMEGEAGLVRSVILNDRIHALTVDTAGEVAVWDVVRGACLGKYVPEDVAAASQSGSVSSGGGETKERSPREALEAVRERIEGEGIANTWCTADTKAGVLTLHLTEKCFETEVYADEAGFAHDSYFTEDSKLNVGKWVLRNLFINFIKEEMKRKSRESGESLLPPPSISRNESSPADTPRPLRHRRGTSSERRATKQHIPMSSTVVCSPKMIPAITPISTAAPPRTSPLLTPMIPLHPPPDMLTPIAGSPAPPSEGVQGSHQRTRSATFDSHLSRTPSMGQAKEDYFSIRTRQPSMSDETPTPGPVSAGGVQGAAGAKSEPPSTPSTPGGLMGRLKSASPILGDTTPTIAAIRNPCGRSEDPNTTLLMGPLTPPGNADAPLYGLPQQTVVLLSEEATPTYKTLYRGLVASTHHDLRILEEAMPMWLAEYLLLNKLPPTAPLAKLSFVLLPWNKSSEAEPLPEVLNSSQMKLTASRYLRISKILVHVRTFKTRSRRKLEKGSKTESRAGSVRSSVDSSYQAAQARAQQQKTPQPRAEEVYEILCNEAILPIEMTLAAVRQYVWRQSAELVMYYRRKAVASPSLSNGAGTNV